MQFKPKVNKGKCQSDGKNPRKSMLVKEIIFGIILCVLAKMVHVLKGLLVS